MSVWAVILIGSLLMSLVALVGGITLILPPRRLRQLLPPLVSVAAGSLLGGALFHMLPEGFEALDPLRSGVWIALGFTAFLALEQFLHWHQAHHHPPAAGDRLASRSPSEPLALLILLGAVWGLRVPI